MDDCRIYLITPPRIDDLEAFAKDLEAALSAAPVACLQLRLKYEGEVADSSVVVQAAERIKPILHAAGALLILNDDAALAERVGADGVHLGQSDGSLSEARELLGEDAVIGATCHTSRDLAFEAAAAGADYVAFGAYYPTSTKTPPSSFEGEQGLELLQWWQEAMEVPCVAIGGITPDNARPPVEAGADFVAVSSGVWSWPGGPAEAVRLLSEACRR